MCVSRLQKLASTPTVAASKTIIIPGRFSCPGFFLPMTTILQCCHIDQNHFTHKKHIAKLIRGHQRKERKRWIAENSVTAHHHKVLAMVTTQVATDFFHNPRIAHHQLNRLPYHMLTAVFLVHRTIINQTVRQIHFTGIITGTTVITAGNIGRLTSHHSIMARYTSRHYHLS